MQRDASMKKLHIDFARKSVGHSLYHTSLWSWLMLMAGLFLCITAGLSAQALLQRYADQQNAIAHLKARLHQSNQHQALAKEVGISDALSKTVHQAIIQLNLPWRDLFDALEVATPNSIALLSLEPDAKRHLIKGKAEAKSGDDMIAYIESLKRQEFFVEVVLTHHDIHEQDPNRPLRFEFEALWAEPGR